MGERGQGCSAGTDTFSVQKELEKFALLAMKAMKLDVIKTSLLLRILVHHRMSLMVSVEV